MNLKQAIQKQIDDIMDSYEFDKCAKILKFLKESGEPYPDRLFVDGEPFQTAMRNEARRFLCQVGEMVTRKREKFAFCGGGYFKATAVRGKDDIGKWVRLDLHFGIDGYTEGVSYED